MISFKSEISDVKFKSYKFKREINGVSPTLPDGVTTGVATATSFSGDLTGDVTGNADTATNTQGLTGTPNISVGIITATTYVGVPEGTNILKAMLFV